MGWVWSGFVSKMSTFFNANLREEGKRKNLLPSPPQGRLYSRDCLMAWCFIRSEVLATVLHFLSFLNMHVPVLLA